MATKRQKKEEAKRRIAETVPNLPIPRFAPPFLRTLNVITRGAERGGQALVELDPLGIITDDPVIMPARDTTRTEERILMAMVNDPNFTMSDDLQEMINNPDVMMVSNGASIMPMSGRDVIRQSKQFAMQGFDLPVTRRKPRKKTKTDKIMSKALAQANKELRKKNGQLRSGVTQADIMRRAHRIRRKLS